MRRARAILGAGNARHGVTIAALLACVFVVQITVRDLAIGVGYLYVLPTLVAAVWFGGLGGLTVGIAGAGLFLAAAALGGEDHLLTATLVRLLVLCTVGYAFGAVLRSERVARRALAGQARELSELRALRSALVPPEVPDQPAVDLATCFVPAQERVAGDFFVVQQGPDDSTVVVVGDVVGKGLEAARRAAFVRAALAAYAPYEGDPCRLLELANAALVESTGTSEEFVTAACVVYRPDDHSLSWALAGHPPPMLLDRGGRLHGIEPGLPLGLADRIDCSRGQRRLAHGDGVLLFTDGLTEARRPFSELLAIGQERGRPRPELFGDDRIAAVLAEHAGEEPRTVLGALRAAAERFTGGGLADDLCMVAVRAKQSAL